LKWDLKGAGRGLSSQRRIDGGSFTEIITGEPGRRDWVAVSRKKIGSHSKIFRAEGSKEMHTLLRVDQKKRQRVFGGDYARKRNGVEGRSTGE